MKRANLLRWVRRTWVQGTVGKTIATVLLVAMVMLVRFSFSRSALDEQPPIISVNIPYGSLWLKQVTPQIVVKDDIDPKPTFVALLGDKPYRVGTPIREPGVYELRILARDSSGNSSEKAVMFQVLEQPHYIASLAVVQWHYEVEGDWAGLDAWLLLYGPFIPDKRLQALGDYPEAIPVCVVEPLHFSMLVLDEEGMPLNRGEAILPAGIKRCKADSSPRCESVYYDPAKDIVALHFRVTPQERILRKGVPVSVKIVGVATVKAGDFTFEAAAASSANPAFGDTLREVIGLQNCRPCNRSFSGQSNARCRCRWVSYPAEFLNPDVDEDSRRRGCIGNPGFTEEEYKIHARPHRIDGRGYTISTYVQLKTV